jgi:AraC-like DNA-binding protein
MRTHDPIDVFSHVGFTSGEPLGGFMIYDLPAGKPSDATNCPLVYEVCDPLARRFAEQWTVSAVAACVKRDRSYLSRLFKRRTGVTVHRFLVLQRLRHAGDLICRGEKIEVAALLAGFRSRRAFYQVFKSSYGVTPSAFRRSVLRIRHDAGAPPRPAEGTPRESQSTSASPARTPTSRVCVLPIEDVRAIAVIGGQR